MPLTIEEGRQAVTLAREALEAHVRGSEPKPFASPGIFGQKRGVFVTLNKAEHGSRSLRGCIGYSEPIRPLAQAIKEVAVYASEDPRFPSPVGRGELDMILVEVSILTPPRDLEAPSRREIPSMVRIGTDGLVISNGFTSGLFLPQVATEQGWDQETFVSEACAKAGLPLDAWLDNGTRVQVFQAEIFAETEPGGRIVRVNPESEK